MTIFVASASIVGATTTSVSAQALSLRDIVGGLLPITRSQDQPPSTQPSPVVPTSPIVSTPQVVLPSPQVQQQPTTIQRQPQPQIQPTISQNTQSTNLLTPVNTQPNNAISEQIPDTSGTITQLAAAQSSRSVTPILYTTKKISLSERNRMYLVGAIGLVIGTLLYVFSYRYSRQWVYGNVVGSPASMTARSK